MTERYFKLDRGLPKSKDYESVVKSITEAHNAQELMSDKYGFTQWRSGNSVFILVGGLSACIFKEKPDAKIWKRVNFESANEYYPRRTTKIGKELHEQFGNMPCVEKKTLNAIFGYTGKHSSINNVGFNWSNPDYYLFCVTQKVIEETTSLLKRLEFEGYVEITYGEYEKLSDATK